MQTASFEPVTKGLAPALAAGLATVLWAGLIAGATAAAILGPQVIGVDGLTLVLGLLTVFVAAVVTTFARRYMRADRNVLGFYLTIGLLVASVLLFIVARDLITLAVGWCVSGVLLAKLIGHKADWPEAQSAARRALRSFAVGDAALLASLALLGLSAGSARLDVVLAKVEELPAGLSLTAALLLLAGAAARCALPPFSGWLLSSMTAPTPVSALMHAGLVNAGGFLLIRFAPLIEAAPGARAAAVALGLVAAIYGIGVMTVRPDIKRSLAGSTVSQMGFMIMSCGLGAYAAALWHIVAHGLFKAWLFLGSGSAIGARSDKPAGMNDARSAALVALATMAAGLVLTLDGAAPNGSLVPLMLGFATAGVTLIAGLRSGLPVRARLSVAGLVILLLAVHAGGLSLTYGLIGPDAAPILPVWALLTLLGAFLAAWVWQQQRRASAAPLPPQLYIHLLNAGAVPASLEN